MEIDFDRLFISIKSISDAALSEIAADSVKSLQDSLAEERGERVGSHSPPPWKVSGDLQGSINSSEVRDGQVTIYSDSDKAFYAEFLENGGYPFMRPEFNRLTSSVLPKMREKLRQKGGFR